MSPIIERLAKALRAGFEKNAEAHGDWFVEEDAEFQFDGWVYPEPIVRAILTALREPTDAMIGAGGEACGDRRDHPNSPAAQLAWEAMIDAALEEIPQPS